MAEQLELTKALRQARLAEASKLDATLDLRDARALRLDALRAELMPLLVDASAGSLFELNIQSGDKPKLWLDLISSVVMEPDPRTYRLVQDQDNRRDIFFESTDLKAMVGYVVKYLAHRIITHEKMARGLAVPQLEKYSLVDLVFVWVTGCAFGVLALLIAAMLMGKLHF